MDIKPLIAATFIFSAAVHMPIVFFLEHYYFGSLAHSSQSKESPVFSYVPEERDLQIKKIARPFVETVKESVRPQQDSTEPESQKHLKPTQQKKHISRTGDEILAELIGLSSMAQVSQVIPPTVENVDLSDSTVRQAFFNYYDLLSTLIARFAVYPEDARRQKLEGVAYVSFLLRKNGSLGEILLRHSSGYGLLDRSAMSAVQNAAPFPPLPVEINKDTIRINVPISFEIQTV
jgi:periplasmic protein TonB